MRRSPEPVLPATDVPERVDLVEGLQLVPVQNPAQSAVWNELMEHPLGKAVLVGCQCRYLVGSARLGAVGFAASARRLAARDSWLGWDDKTRERRLHRIVGLNRFLPRHRLPQPRVAGVEHVADDDGTGLRGTLRPPPLVGGDFCRPGTRASRSARRTGFM